MRCILIAGGGTGGHIYPAIAIAQALKKKDPELSVEFVGTARGLETKIIPREGYPLHLISASALNNVSFMTKLISLLVLPRGILQSIFLIIKLKPTAVIGVGGYASGPMMLAAVLLRQNTAIFEPNAHPGLTNRWLAHFVDVAFVNFEASRKFFKNALALGMPVRKGLNQSPKEMTGKNGIDGKLKVLIFGGSQGARGINTAVLEAFKKDPSWSHGFETVHQIGATDWKRFDDEYKKLGVEGVSWFEFLYDMPERYKWADLVLCRAGAATLSELSSCSKASVLVPFAGAADNHQQKNAEALVEKSAAQMILQKDFTPEKFIEILQYFNTHRDELKKLEVAIRSFHIDNAAENIAAQILKNG